jgi:hypothetical protein
VLLAEEADGAGDDGDAPGQIEVGSQGVTSDRTAGAA